MSFDNEECLSGREKAEYWRKALITKISTDDSLTYQLTEEDYVLLQTEIGGALVNFACEDDEDFEDDFEEEEENEEGGSEDDDDVISFSSEDASDEDEDEDWADPDDDNDDDAVYMLVQIPIMPLPKKRQDVFYKKVLELNSGLLSPGRLAIDSDMLVLDMGINVNYLSEEALLDIVLNAISTAPSVATELILEFGVKMFPWLKDN